MKLIYTSAILRNVINSKAGIDGSSDSNEVTRHWLKLERLQQKQKKATVDTKGMIFKLEHKINGKEHYFLLLFQKISIGQIRQVGMLNRSRLPLPFALRFSLERKFSKVVFVNRPQDRDVYNYEISCISVNRSVHTLSHNSASKGRKVRYNVHQKLVGFYPKRDGAEWSMQQRNQLYRGVFN